MTKLQPGSYDVFGSDTFLLRSMTGEFVQPHLQRGLLRVYYEVEVIAPKDAILHFQRRPDPIVRHTTAPPLVDPDRPRPLTELEIQMRNLSAYVDSLAIAQAKRRVVTPAAITQAWDAAEAADLSPEVVADDPEPVPLDPPADPATD